MKEYTDISDIPWGKAPKGTTHFVNESITNDAANWTRVTYCKDREVFIDCLFDPYVGCWFDFTSFDEIPSNNVQKPTLITKVVKPQRKVNYFGLEVIVSPEWDNLYIHTNSDGCIYYSSFISDEPYIVAGGGYFSADQDVDCIMICKVELPEGFDWKESLVEYKMGDLWA